MFGRNPRAVAKRKEGTLSREAREKKQLGNKYTCAPSEKRIRRETRESGKKRADDGKKENFSSEFLSKRRKKKITSSRLGRADRKKPLILAAENSHTLLMDRAGKHGNQRASAPVNK